MECLVVEVFCIAVCLSLGYTQTPSPSSTCTLEGLANLDTRILEYSLASSSNREVPLPSVAVEEMRIVCLAISPNFFTYRSASLVVRYRCVGVLCPKGECKLRGGR